MSWIEKPQNFYKFLILILFIVGVFGPNYRVDVPIGFQISFTQASLILSGILLVIGDKLRVPCLFIALFSILLLHGLIAAFINYRPPSITFIVQLSIFIFGLCTMYSFARFIGIKKSTDLFVIIAVIASLAIIGEQFFSLVTGGGLIRNDGLLREPSEASYIVAPGFFLSMRRSKKLIPIIGVALILTFSATTYFAIFAAFLVFSLGQSSFIKRHAFYVIVVLLGISVIFMPWVGDRFQSVTNIISESLDKDLNIEHVRKYGGSIGQLIINGNVTKETLLDTFLIGVGFGDFRYAFSEQYHIEELRQYGNLLGTAKGGGNLIFRMLSELGFLGMLIILISVVTLVRVVRVNTRIKPKFRTMDQFVLYDCAGIALIIASAYFARKSLYFDPIFLLGLSLGFLAWKETKKSIHHSRKAYYA